MIALSGSDIRELDPSISVLRINEEEKALKGVYLNPD